MTKLTKVKFLLENVNTLKSQQMNHLKTKIKIKDKTVRLTKVQ